MDKAMLSSFDKYTTFTYGGKTLTFRTCDGLERYMEILKWDDGYIEVLAKYRQSEKPIVEYIDLTPVLDGLYMDRSAFLNPISEVVIEYEKENQMTYKLNPAIEKILSPVTLILPDGEKKSYENGIAAVADTFAEPYIVSSIRAVENEIEITLKIAPSLEGEESFF